MADTGDVDDFEDLALLANQEDQIPDNIDDVAQWRGTKNFDKSIKSLS